VAQVLATDTHLEIRKYVFRFCTSCLQLDSRWSLKRRGGPSLFGNSNEVFMIFKERTIYGIKAFFGDGHLYKLPSECSLPSLPVNATH